MLSTPLGRVGVFVDDEEIEFRAIGMGPGPVCRDVDGRFLIEYRHKRAARKQKVRCCLLSPGVRGEIESGERLEAISFFGDSVKVTIGIEAAFCQEAEYGYNYGGRYLGNGIEYETNPATGNQSLSFGISWICPCTEMNEHQTWFGADPALMR